MLRVIRSWRLLDPACPAGVSVARLVSALPFWSWDRPFWVGFRRGALQGSVLSVLFWIALAVWLLCSACAVGSAGFDDQGRPRVWGAALWSKVEACPPEDDEGCAGIGAGGLSDNAADAVRESGVLSWLRDTGQSAVKRAAKWTLGVFF